MAAGRLPPPGSEYGPCEDQTCKHIDCAETRRMAASVCRFCKQIVGYERGFYCEQDGSFVHSSCLEDAIDAERQAARQGA